MLRCTMRRVLDAGAGAVFLPRMAASMSPPGPTVSTRGERRHLFSSKTASVGEAWTAIAMRQDSEQWQLHLTSTQQEALKSAAGELQHRGVALEAITAEDAANACPSLVAELNSVRQSLCKGRGFSLIKGLPVDPGVASTWEALCMYLLLGLQVGAPVTQNAHGHLIGHVCDHREDANDPALRIYRTSQPQRFHTDSADVVGLLCLSNAADGGLSSIASSVSVHKRMRELHPRHCDVLEGNMVWDRKGEVPKGKKPFYLGPVFNKHDGKVLTIYDRKFFETASRFEGVDQLTELELEALDLFEELANSTELRLDMKLEPGDVQFIHNHQILHARSAFTDLAPGRRHLIRLWLSLNEDNGWSLPPAFGDGRYANIDRGGGQSVGGILAEGGKPPNYPIEPE